MNKKGIIMGIGQLLLIILVWMFNPNAMVERISDLLLVFGIGCVTGLIAPIMVTIEDEYILTWAVIFEMVYAVTLVVLLGVIYYNIVI